VAGYPAASVEMSEDSPIVVSAAFDTRLMPAISAHQVELFSRDFLQRASLQLGVTLEDVALRQSYAPQKNLHVISYARLISGIEVRDSKLSLIFSVDRQGYRRLREVINQTWAEADVLPRPTGARLTDNLINKVIRENGARVIASGDSYQVAHRTGLSKLAPTTWYDVESEDGKKYTLTFSGGSEPTLIEAFSDRTGVVVEAPAYVRNWTGEQQSFPVPDATLITNLGQQQKLNADGRMPDGVTGGTVVLRSKWATVMSAMGRPTQFAIESDGAKARLKTEGDAAVSTLNTYIALSRVRSYAMTFLSADEVPYLNKTLRVTTDIGDECNAYYQGLTLRFFSRGSRCANMGTMNDVIYHEWGHGLDDFTGSARSAQYGGGMTDSAFSEGIGDIVSMFMVHDSNMAPGFFTNDPKRPIRRLENKRMYRPGQPEAEIHEQGTIVGGAFWELRKRMMNKYGAAGHDKAASLFFNHLKQARSYKESYTVVQRIADDDNNPATRHSDWCLINHAFAEKNLVQRDSCQDGFEQESDGLDGSDNAQTEIFVALDEASQQGAATPVRVAVSNSAARQAKICIGRDQCTNPVVMSSGTNSSGSVFFGPVPVPISDSTIFNVQVLDANGRELGRRIVRVSQK
jgi:hypothetical protein